MSSADYRARILNTDQYSHKKVHHVPEPVRPDQVLSDASDSILQAKRLASQVFLTASPQMSVGARLQVEYRGFQKPKTGNQPPLQPPVQRDTTSTTKAAWGRSSRSTSEARTEWEEVQPLEISADEEEVEAEAKLQHQRLVKQLASTIRRRSFLAGDEEGGSGTGSMASLLGQLRGLKDYNGDTELQPSEAGEGNSAEQNMSGAFVSAKAELRDDKCEKAPLSVTAKLNPVLQTLLHRGHLLRDVNEEERQAEMAALRSGPSTTSISDKLPPQLPLRPSTSYSTSRLPTLRASRGSVNTGASFRRSLLIQVQTPSRAGSQELEVAGELVSPQQMQRVASSPLRSPGPWARHLLVNRVGVHSALCIIVST